MQARQDGFVTRAARLLVAVGYLRHAELHQYSWPMGGGALRRMSETGLAC